MPDFESSGMGTVADAVRSVLGRVAHGQLLNFPATVHFWDGSELTGVSGGPEITVRPGALAWLIHEPNQIGLVRAYVSGDIQTDEKALDRLLASRALAENVHLSALDRIRALRLSVQLGGASVLRPPAPPGIEASPHGRRHSLRRDREVISHHYDVSNDFYAALLGPTMVYSCAYFSDPLDTLEEAQERKLDVICRKLRLAPGDRFLDIGCGWGSLVIHAARHYGVQAVGITVSAEQAALARERVAAAGLQDNCEIRLIDYRELDDGPYDKIASVGMYEHVGGSQLRDYAQLLVGLLAPGGLVLNHGIVRLFSTAAGSKSMIQRYIFPDGELQTLERTVQVLQGAGLEVRDVESLREHYDLTLRRWLANLPDAARFVDPERARAWQLYLLGSALAFEAADISVEQILATRPGAGHGLPLDRRALLEPVAGDQWAASL